MIAPFGVCQACVFDAARVPWLHCTLFFGTRFAIERVNVSFALLLRGSMFGFVVRAVVCFSAFGVVLVFQCSVILPVVLADGFQTCMSLMFAPVGVCRV